MNETKRIIVEFGARRQRFTLPDRLISTSELVHRLGTHFGIVFDENSTYTLQKYDSALNEYHSLDDVKQTIDIIEDIEQLHRFRIVRTPIKSQKILLLNNLQSTVGKLHDATRDVDKIQNLVCSLNRNCTVLNQLMDGHPMNSNLDQMSVASPTSNYSLNIDNQDATQMQLIDDSDDDNFESVSCCAARPVYVNSKPRPPPPPVIVSRKKQPPIENSNLSQTRLIPCKYAIRGSCQLGDKCLYLHDETCIRSAREWERRL